MKAVICSDFNESLIQDVQKPEPGPHEVLLSVKRVQLSVTECQLFRGMSLSSVEEIHSRMTEGDGRVFGHEFCGVIEDSGEKVTSLSIGDRVFAPAKISCGECAYCQADYTQLCNDKTTLGMGVPGALAEYVCLPEEPLRRLPETVSNAEGAAMQPLASAVLCVHDAEITTGDVVSVVGCGVMGFQSAQLARHQGASEVIVVDVDPKKLEIAKNNGFKTIDANSENPVRSVKDITSNVGADVVIEAVGGEQDHVTQGKTPIAQAISMVRSGGTLLQVGLLIGEANIHPRTLRNKSIRWIHPRFGVLSIGPNTDTGVLAPKLVSEDEVSLDELIGPAVDGLESFEQVVEMTLNKEQHGILGPPQIVIA
jgi:threonine dehydrogenase-like Zn-dependent dehydrogenase